MKELALKYGCNPNQKPARIFMTEGELPIEVLNGKPGYINFCDAFNSWQLVRALKKATGLPAAASFKHVSPAGAALGKPLTDIEKQMYFVDTDKELSPIACAYIRARGADRLCSYGDWAALSDTCDADTASYLAHEVSDGIIAPDFTAEALEILKTKRKGGYNVVKIDPNYEPKPIEQRDIFGIRFEQGYNNYEINESQHRYREQESAGERKARHDPCAHHAQVHAVQLGLLRQGRHDHRCRRRSAEPHPLHPSGRQQGRQLVRSSASEGSRSAVC